MLNPTVIHLEKEATGARCPLQGVNSLLLAQLLLGAIFIYENVSLHTLPCHLFLVLTT